MKSISKLLSNISFLLAVMIAFLLFVQDKMVLPAVLQSIGRLHPLILHFPIVLMIVLAVLWFMRHKIETVSFNAMFDPLLRWTVCTALFSSLFGLFLSKESGYDGDLLFYHKYLAIVFSFLIFLIGGLYQWRVNTVFISIGMVIALSMMILGTHFGAQITHGKGFITQPLMKEKTDQDSIMSKSFYVAAVEPVLRSKCFSCHNEHKTKGGLDMSSIDKLLEGGDEGPVIKSGDAAHSMMIQNIHLPLDEKKHMPPNGKTPLTKDEINLLTAWIDAGANADTLFKAYLPTDTLISLANKIIHTTISESKKYSFAAAPSKLIASLNDPFCTITPIAQNSPALRADFYVREKYNPLKMQELLKIKDQLTVLNLDNMPVKDEVINTLLKFNQLEELNLNHSAITTKTLEELKNLPSLRLLSLAGVKLDLGAIKILSQYPALKKVYLWNTSIVDSMIPRKDTKIEFNTGYIPDENEVLSLTPPTFTNESSVLDTGESVLLKHQIPGVTIRYTINDSIPDSTSSPIYQHPIFIYKYTIIKARAVKEGWLSSGVATFNAFKKGITPSRAMLLSSPNAKYRADGKVLIDNQKGNIGNLLEPGWIAYREVPMDVIFYFEQSPTIHHVTVSYNKSVNGYIVPPTEVILSGSQDSLQWKIIKKIIPPPLTKKDLGVYKNDIIDIECEPLAYKYYRLKMQNVTKLPKWHSGKGEKGWLFVDEVFFY